MRLISHCCNSGLFIAASRRWISLITRRFTWGLSHMPKLYAISLWAYVPPYLPALEIIPMAPVLEHHSLAVKIKRFVPAEALIASNSMQLKFGLLNSSQARPPTTNQMQITDFMLRCKRGSFRKRLQKYCFFLIYANLLCFLRNYFMSCVQISEAINSETSPFAFNIL